MENNFKVNMNEYLPLRDVVNPDMVSKKASVIQGIYPLR